MKPEYILKLFHHISTHASCPKCQGKFFPENLSVDFVFPQSVLMCVRCPLCNEVSQAHVFANILAPASSPKRKKSPRIQISAEEVDAMHTLLSQCQGGVSELFSPQR